MGLGIVIFLCEHLLTNSQAALWFNDDGRGFISAVNSIANLPYLHVLEILLIGVPFFVHIIWGIKYLFTGKFNSLPTDGTTPSLTEYSKNHAYTWQRITSWILIVAVAGHVVHMRFVNYPASGSLGSQEYYMVNVSLDDGLYTLASRLNVKLYDGKTIDEEMKKWQEKPSLASSFGETIHDNVRNQLLLKQKKREEAKFIANLKDKWKESKGVVAAAQDFGTAELLIVRDAFKSPLMMILYTILVLAAVYHASHGLWTFLITWGISLTDRAQKLMRRAALSLMLLLAFLGLSAIWGTYLITLRS